METKTEKTEEHSNSIEDLTVDQTDSRNVKAGAVDWVLRIEDVKGETK